jgi:CHAT domain-containing protein
VQPTEGMLIKIQKSDGIARPRLHWCPTGAFTFVPVHAAGIYEGLNQESCSEYVVSSYTPTLTALLRAQNGAQRVVVNELQLSLIAAGYTEDLHLPALPSVQDEVETVIHTCTRANVSLDTGCISEPITAQVDKAFESAHLVHIACHGIQHPSDPLQSAFCLNKGKMKVEHLMRLELKKAFLAFLSACETAKGDKNQPDQTIHLAATMLFAGFKGVVATMW